MITTEAIELLLTTMLHNAWSALEILMEDIWVAGIDHGGWRFSEAAAGDKQFSMGALRPHMKEGQIEIGSLLRTTKRVTFMSFIEQRKNYSDAFGREVESVFDLHKQSPSDVLMLEALRNQILHNGNEIDKDCANNFAMAEGSSLPEVQRLKEKDNFQIDGEIVNKLILSACQFAQNLFRVIDKTLTPDAIWTAKRIQLLNCLLLRSSAISVEDWVI